MQLQRRRPDSTLWKQLELPAHRETLETLRQTHGAEALLPVVLELMQHERGAGRRGIIGGLGYTAFFLASVALTLVWNPAMLIFPMLQILFSPVVLVILRQINQEQTPRRLNLMRLLRVTVRELTDSTKVPEVIQAVRSIGVFEDPVLRRELRQELGRLLLRLPVEQARQLTPRERLYLRLWLWDAMQWDQAGDSEFCMAALLTLGDARDRWVRPLAWLCVRGHHSLRVREAARACMDELSQGRE